MMTVGEVVKQLKRMPQDIPFLVEAYNDNIKRWGNHQVDLVTHHYHENKDNQPLINECVVMIDYDSCKYGIIKDDGTTMTDEELRDYFANL